MYRIYKYKTVIGESKKVQDVGRMLPVLFAGMLLSNCESLRYMSHCSAGDAFDCLEAAKILTEVVLLIKKSP